QKWPERYNAAGHVTWSGRVYAKPMRPFALWRSRVYQGTWGSAPYQPLDDAPPLAVATALMPEWYLVIAVLAAISALGALWAPLFLALPLLGAGAVVPVAHAISAARSARFGAAPASRLERMQLRAVVAGLHVLQPLARLRGRFALGLTPWRLPKREAGAAPSAGRATIVWSAHRQSADAWLRALDAKLRALRIVALHGGPYDGWDLEVRGGLFGGARALLGIEEHAAGRQLLRLRVRSRIGVLPLAATVALGALGTAAGLDGAFAAAGILGTAALALTSRIAVEVAVARRSFACAFAALRAEADRQ
ncbi:MAG: glycosyl transferase, partial [Candidatus Eremiobacteraeota bacterium]|nr:glycosyl transferase [Candidatus Eremiobacteraeota bacterium]